MDPVDDFACFPSQLTQGRDKTKKKLGLCTPVGLYPPIQRYADLSQPNLTTYSSITASLSQGAAYQLPDKGEEADCPVAALCSLVPNCHENSL